VLIRSRTRGHEASATLGTVPTSCTTIKLYVPSARPTSRRCRRRCRATRSAGRLVESDRHLQRQAARVFLCSNPVGIQMDGVDQKDRTATWLRLPVHDARHVNERGYDVGWRSRSGTLRFVPGPRDVRLPGHRDVKRNAPMPTGPVTRNINSYSCRWIPRGCARATGRNFQVNPSRPPPRRPARQQRMKFDDPRGRFARRQYGITSN